MRQFFLGLFLPLAAFSLPSGGAVKGGEASLALDKNALHITSQSERAAIEWNKFSIAEHEAVHFHQPSNNSAVLNNVIGGDISHLMGSLESKFGKVYIVNPNGIIIGKDAIINVGGLVASTLKITNEDFFQGNDHFFGSERSRVVNLGQITAHSGDINVISYQIDNRGELLAPEGTVALSAASEAWLQPNSNKKVLIKTTLESADSEENGISNSGVIRALQTELDADGNIYKFAINHSGSIEAPTLEEQNGRVFLRAEKGCAKVTGSIEAPGGHVEVLADRIGIDEEAFIDVSHEKQAGEILIGGDWRGENTPFRANHSYLGPDAALHANGIGSGNGGTVILWGELSSRVFGEASARGGALGGDGGKIEVSRVPLLATKRLFADAPHGVKGTLLFDPPNITISTAASTPADVVPNGGSYEFEGTTVELNIQNSQITDFLDANTNVVIDVNAGDSTAAGEGNITIDDDINWTGTGDLTLVADPSGTIQVNDSIKGSGGSGCEVTLRAKSIILGQADHLHTKLVQVNSSGDVNIEFTAPDGGIEMYASSVLLGTGAEIQSSATVNIGNASTYTGLPGDILMRPAGPGGFASSVYIDGIGALDLTANNITIDASGNGTSANLQGYIKSSNNASVTAEGNITLNAGGNATSAQNGVGIRAFDDLTMQVGGTITLNSTGTQNIDINAGGNICQIGASDNRIGSLTMTTSGTGKAYIMSNGPLSIYGTRTASSNEAAMESRVEIFPEEISHVGPSSQGLGYTPADGDVYIESKATLTLDLDAPTFTSNSGNVYLVGDDITFGQVNGGGTADDPMWALNSANNFIFELTEESGVLQFNEGLTNAGTGALTLKGGIINLGTSAHTHTNEILVKPTGALTVDFIHNNGQLAIYGSSISGKEARLTSAATSSGITVQEATGKSGAQVLVEGDTDEGQAYLGEYNSSTGELAIDITLNSGGNATSGHKSIYVLNQQSQIGADKEFVISVPRDIYADNGSIRTWGVSNASFDLSAENISVVSSGDTYLANIESTNGFTELSVTGTIEVSASGAQSAYIRGNGLEITRADGGIAVTSSGSGDVYIGVPSGSNGDLDIGWTSKNDIGPIVITASDSGNAYMSAGRDQVQINGSADITLTSSGVGGAYIEAAGGVGSDKNITIGSTANDRRRAGAILIESTAGAGNAYFNAPNGSIAMTSGAISLIDARLFAGGAGGVSLTSGGTITSNGGDIEADAGSVTLVSDVNVTFSGAAQTTAGSGSIIIASDQAAIAPGIGHINIGENTTFTASDELRFFCGYFENNNISKSANLNGGTFSGVIDKSDANNIYEVIYDPNNLPTEYGEPYTFYYEDLTPTDSITSEVEKANILLTSTLVGSSQLSSDAALTQLARFRARFVERGRPFKEPLIK